MEPNIEISGQMIKYYFICKRKLWLSFNKIEMEQNSDLVKIGTYLHKNKYKDKSLTEVNFGNIRIDGINGEFVEEFKKSNSELESSKMQLLYYLFELKNKGIIKKGMLKFEENRDSIIMELTDENEKLLKEILLDIKVIITQEICPSVINHKKCKLCSYFEYCNI